jgi:ribonuclease VapC
MIVVDSSVVVAIMRGEDDSSTWADVLDKADRACISVVSFVETSMVVMGRRAGADPRNVDALLKSLGIDVMSVTLDQGYAARDAFAKYGKGRHAARLNLADCFAYALAKSRNAPLLFKGDDFSRTDVVPAWRP